MGGSVVAGHVTGAARPGWETVLAIGGSCLVRAGLFPRLALFSIGGDGCFCQAGKSFNIVGSINSLIMCFLFFGRGYR